jgi:HlyD family secretion protein
VRNLWAIVVFGLAAGVGGWLAYAFDVAGNLQSQFGKTAPGAVPRNDLVVEPSSVVALGRIEPAGGVVSLGALAPDQLRELRVAQGDSVKQNQILAVLAGERLREIEIESIDRKIEEAKQRRAAEEKLADAKIVAARAAIAQVEAAKADIEAKQREVELLRANLEQARKDQERLAALSDELVSPQQREQQQLVVQKAEAELRAAEAAVTKLTRTQEVQMTVAQADLAAAEAGKDQILSTIPTESLQTSRKAAEAELARTRIVAPTAGTVLRMLAEPGEPAGPATVIELADLSKMVVVAEVYETDVKRVVEGATAKITSRALRSPYDEKGLAGRVVHIDRMIAKPDLASLDPTAKADRRVVEVRIALDDASTLAAANWVNLQVDVTISGDETSR